MLNTQGIIRPNFITALLTFIVDDMFLTTPMFDPPNATYRVVPNDLADHIPWMASINSRLPAGSNYTIEIGHNGNGNIGVCSCCVLPCLNPNDSRPNSTISISVRFFPKFLRNSDELTPY